MRFNDRHSLLGNSQNLSVRLTKLPAFNRRYVMESPVLAVAPGLKSASIIYKIKWRSLVTVGF